MDINTYCERYSVKKQDIARKAPAGIRTITKVSGGVKVSCVVALRIDKATGGKVTAEEICNNLPRLAIFREFEDKPRRKK